MTHAANRADETRIHWKRVLEATLDERSVPFSAGR